MVYNLKLQKNNNKLTRSKYETVCDSSFGGILNLNFKKEE